MGTHPVFFVHNEAEFWRRCRETFIQQFEHNALFGRFCRHLGYQDGRDFTPEFIPFMPVEAFRDHEVMTGHFQPELTFRSSGTGAMQRSRHLVRNPELYHDSFTFAFDFFFPDDPVLLAYTPGYADNPDSSLVYMLRGLISRDGSGLSRFLELGRPIPKSLLADIHKSGRQLVLFGAAFGLLEMAEHFPVDLPPGSLIVETGGMKTYRKEMNRSEMHAIMSEAFCIDAGSIQSEYGMCELLSQAYAKDGHHFRTPFWMKLLVVKGDDPFHLAGPDVPGRLAVIDLANQDSCAFILTGDRAVQRPAGVEILGRWNAWDLRGCNFLLEAER